MSIPRITPHQASEVERLKAAGRTLRQIENVLGLTYGMLSKPYRVADDGRPIIDRQFGTVWVYPSKPETEN